MNALDMDMEGIISKSADDTKIDLVEDSLGFLGKLVEKWQMEFIPDM